MWTRIIDFASLLTESRFIIICIVLSGFPIDFLCGLQHRKACENETLWLFVENNPLTDLSCMFLCI